MEVLDEVYEYSSERELYEPPIKTTPAEWIARARQTLYWATKTAKSAGVSERDQDEA